MSKLLVFLHGFGFDKNDNAPFIAALAKHLGADVLAIDGPLPSHRERGGYAWYRIEREPRKHILDEKIKHSAKYIKDHVEKKLKERRLSWDDVVLCGRSQGGFMSVYMALTGWAKPKMVISLCGLYPEEMRADGLMNKDVPIVWIEAQNDDVLPDEHKESYRWLQDEGCKIKHIIAKNSDHNNLNIEEIENII